MSSRLASMGHRMTFFCLDGQGGLASPGASGGRGFPGGLDDPSRFRCSRWSRRYSSSKCSLWSILVCPGSQGGPYCPGVC